MSPFDPRQQRRHQLGAITAQRITLSLRSARHIRLNTSRSSHNAGGG
jgi:hypothetical protein